MSDLIGGLAQAAASQGEQSRPEQAGKQAGGRSFESVLKQGANGDAADHGGASPAPTRHSPDAPAGVSGAQLEQFRVSLTKDIQSIDPAGSSRNDFYRDLIDGRTRSGMLKEAMSGVGGAETKTDVREYLKGTEEEWHAVEAIMKSDKELSTGQLLGLQARLYQVSQHVEVMSKVVDQVTGGIKTVLNTNV